MSYYRSRDRGFGRPDLPFAIVLGLYVAVFFAPVVVTSWWLAIEDPWSFLGLASLFGPGEEISALRATVVVGGLLLVIATAATRRTDGIAERLGRTRWTWLLVLGPIVFAVVVHEAGKPAYALLDPSVALVASFSVNAALLGVIVAVMATNRYAECASEVGSIDAVWSAAWSSRDRRRIKFVLVLAFVLQIVGEYVASLDLFSLLFYLTIGGAFFLTGRSRRYRATGHGLEIRYWSGVRRLLDWSSFQGYRRTDDAIVLSRREPWRFSVRCALEDIEDPDAVEDALYEHLPRHF